MHFRTCSVRPTATMRRWSLPVSAAHRLSRSSLYGERRPRGGYGVQNSFGQLLTSCEGRISAPGIGEGRNLLIGQDGTDAVPLRSNEKQQIIEMLKRMTAPAGCRVRTSSFLRGAQDIPREVDVVVECDVDGQVFTQSFEVLGKSRPATLEWVEQMIQKHAELPTDRLFLVSWSGFSKNAMAVAKSRPGVIPVVPLTIEHGRSSDDFAMYFDQAVVAMQGYAVFADGPNGERIQIQISSSAMICTEDGAQVGAPEYVARTILDLPRVGALILDSYAADLDVSKQPIAILTLSFAHASLFVHDELASERTRVAALGVAAAVTHSTERVEMVVREFAKHRFKHGKATLHGLPVVIVAALDQALATTAVQIQHAKGLQSKRNA
jgi:hypothetical protein